jgi:hypothetical protein
MVPLRCGWRVNQNRSNSGEPEAMQHERLLFDRIEE